MCWTTACSSNIVAVSCLMLSVSLSWLGCVFLPCLPQWFLSLTDPSSWGVGGGFREAMVWSWLQGHICSVCIPPRCTYICLLRQIDFLVLFPGVSLCVHSLCEFLVHSVTSVKEWYCRGQRKSIFLALHFKSPTKTCAPPPTLTPPPTLGIKKAKTSVDKSGWTRVNWSNILRTEIRDLGRNIPRANTSVPQEFFSAGRLGD